MDGQDIWDYLFPYTLSILLNRVKHSEAKAVFDALLQLNHGLWD